MLTQSDLSNLDRFVKSAVNNGWLNRRGGSLFLEVLKHYEQTIQQERVQGLPASDKSARDDSKRGSSRRGRNSPRKR